MSELGDMQIQLVAGDLKEDSLGLSWSQLMAYAENRFMGWMME